MSLLNVKAARGDVELTVAEPETMRQARRFIAERAIEGGQTGFRRMREIMRRVEATKPVTVGGTSYWVERF